MYIRFLCIVYWQVLPNEPFFCVSLAGALAVICGLYIVLWGKAKDQEESSTKPENFNKRPTPIDESSYMTICRIDLEEPLLTRKSLDSKDDQTN